MGKRKTTTKTPPNPNNTWLCNYGLSHSVCTKGTTLKSCKQSVLWHPHFSVPFICRLAFLKMEAVSLYPFFCLFVCFPPLEGGIPSNCCSIPRQQALKPEPSAGHSGLSYRTTRAGCIQDDSAILGVENGFPGSCWQWAVPAQPLAPIPITMCPHSPIQWVLPEPQPGLAIIATTFRPKRTFTALFLGQIVAQSHGDRGKVRHQKSSGSKLKVSSCPRHMS